MVCKNAGTVVCWNLCPELGFFYGGLVVLLIPDNLAVSSYCFVDVSCWALVSRTELFRHLSLTDTGLLRIDGC